MLCVIFLFCSSVSENRTNTMGPLQIRHCSGYSLTIMKNRLVHMGEFYMRVPIIEKIYNIGLAIQTKKHLSTDKGKTTRYENRKQMHPVLAIGSICILSIPTVCIRFTQNYVHDPSQNCFPCITRVGIISLQIELKSMQAYCNLLVYFL